MSRRSPASPAAPSAPHRPPCRSPTRLPTATATTTTTSPWTSPPASRAASAATRSSCSARGPRTRPPIASSTPARSGGRGALRRLARLGRQWMRAEDALLLEVDLRVPAQLRGQLGIEAIERGQRFPGHLERGLDELAHDALLDGHERLKVIEVLLVHAQIDVVVDVEARRAERAGQHAQRAAHETRADFVQALERDRPPEGSRRPREAPLVE